MPNRYFLSNLLYYLKEVFIIILYLKTIPFSLPVRYFLKSAILGGYPERGDFFSLLVHEGVGKLLFLAF